MSLENNPQNNIETKINHSGNAPENMRETPVNDFDNTTLQEAVDQNLIGVPKTTEAVGGWISSTETAPRTVEKKGYSTKQKIIAGISGAALALGIGAGLKSMSSNDEHIAPVGPVATAEATPSATATAPEATETVAPIASAEGAALVEAYKSLDIKEFNDLPRAQRLKVVYDTYLKIGEDGALGDFMDEVLADGKAIYDHNPAITPVNPTDNGQVIIDSHVFANSVSAALKQDLSTYGDGPLNFNGAQQLLSGITYEVGKADKSTLYEGMVDVLDDNTLAQKLTGFKSFMALETSPLKEGVDAEGESIKYKDITYNPGTGETFKTRFVYTEFSDKDGQKQALWLISDHVNADESLPK